MSNQRDEDFDSIYASIEDDDDVDEMYVDVSSTSQSGGFGGPSPYVYPQPPSPSMRKLPALPVKSTIGAASKPPWPRRAPQPPPNLASIKIPKSSEQDRNAPLPLPRVGTVKKKEAAGKPVVKSRQAQPQQQAAAKTGYSPPPPITINSGERQAPRYHDSGFDSGKEDPQYKHGFTRNPPSSTAQYKPPPPDVPPPPPRAMNGQDVGGHILNTPSAEDDSEYESLRPARQRILRGFGQQSRRSRRYSSDRIPLQDLASDQENSASDRGYKRREKEENVQNNSRVVCILLTITVIALLISLMSLAMSLYTLTRFELSRRSNNTASECDIIVANCTTNSSNLDCQPSTVSFTYYRLLACIHIHLRVFHCLYQIQEQSWDKRAF